MNVQPNVAFDTSAPAPSAGSQTRPLYWSVRREVWENRSIYMVPLIVCGVAVLGFLISLFGLPKTVRNLDGMDPAHQVVMLATPFSHVAMLLVLVMLFVGVFYTVDALNGERRDRTILFWKSLPVSDRTTVLSKLLIPLVVLPLLTFAVIVVLQWFMFVVSTAVLMLTGAGALRLWTQLPLFQLQLVLLYGLLTLSLWYAPLYAWFLLVSGWARRATFLWILLPPLVLGIFERVVIHTKFIGWLAKSRFIGFAVQAFEFKLPSGRNMDPHFIPLAQLTPAKFLTTPGLWIGLAFAALFLAAAVRLRRNREPI